MSAFGCEADALWTGYNGRKGPPHDIATNSATVLVDQLLPLAPCSFNRLGFAETRHSTR
jgi:hypothetical protein